MFEPIAQGEFRVYLSVEGSSGTYTSVGGLKGVDFSNELSVETLDNEAFGIARGLVLLKHLIREL